ncbi:MAG: hypothetical protein A2Y81_12940 [Nitrospirae bacterium RBG_13_43_8]|nr:MAG: hypothetical protein A2Y81_12940 [Nitrospirae bacterium RBG_13_43_8]
MRYVKIKSYPGTEVVIPALVPAPSRIGPESFFQNPESIWDRQVYYLWSPTHRAGVTEKETDCVGHL